MKKVLIVTYYWPPAGGPGVQRWLKFAKYLPQYGVEPVVYVPENPSYPILDEDLLAEVRDIVVVKRKIVEPYGIASIFSKKTTKISSGIITNAKKQTFVERLLLWIRGNLFIPDARILWVKPSIRFLQQYIADHHIDTVITSGPPHSLHLIGLGLKEVSGVKWIADFRDPWTTIGYHDKLKLSSYAARRHKKLEGQVLNQADQVIVTSKSTKADFEKLTRKPITVITNGYDEHLVERPQLDAKFSLAHIGSLLSDRNPEILWQSLVEIINEIPGFATDFELKLVGTVSAEIHDTIARYGLTQYVSDIGYVQHADAIRAQLGSQVLLLIEIDAEITKSIIPGKVFEYIASGRPIIGIGPADSDFAEIITGTNTGIFVDYRQQDRLKAQIIAYYQQYRDGNLKANGVGIQRYSRKQLTAQLADVITGMNENIQRKK